MDTPDGVAQRGGCSIALPQLARGETQTFQFGIAPKSDMSVMFILRARGGTADM